MKIKTSEDCPKLWRLNSPWQLLGIELWFIKSKHIYSYIHKQRNWHNWHLSIVYIRSFGIEHIETEPAQSYNKKITFFIDHKLLTEYMPKVLFMINEKYNFCIIRLCWFRFYWLNTKWTDIYYRKMALMPIVLLMNIRINVMTFDER